MFMESAKIANVIVAALEDSRYYDIEVANYEGGIDMSIISMHYRVNGAEYQMNNGEHTRYICIHNGVIRNDVDDYFEGEDQMSEFFAVENDFVHIQANGKPREMERLVEICPLADDEIPF